MCVGVMCVTDRKFNRMTMIMAQGLGSKGL